MIRNRIMLHMRRMHSFCGKSLVDKEGKLICDIFRLCRKVRIFEHVSNERTEDEKRIDFQRMEDEKRIALQLNTVKDVEVVQHDGRKMIHASPPNTEGLIPGLSCCLKPMIPSLSTFNYYVSNGKFMKADCKIFEDFKKEKKELFAENSAVKFHITDYRVFRAARGSEVSSKLSIVNDGAAGTWNEDHVSIGPVDSLVVKSMFNESNMVSSVEIDMMPFKLMDEVVYLAQDITGLKEFLRRRPPHEERGLFEAVREFRDGPQQLAVICELVQRMQEALPLERASILIATLEAIRDTIDIYCDSDDFCFLNNCGGPVSDVQEALQTITTSLEELKWCPERTPPCLRA